jgi:hypothetical protein
MKPRNIFRSRRHPGPDPAGVLARIKPGTVTELRHWHEPDCPRPRGGACTCSAVDVEIMEHRDPERN